MIFSPEHIDLMRQGLKTQTRRLLKPGDWIERRQDLGLFDEHSGLIVWRRTVNGKARAAYRTGQMYAACPGRGEAAEGRIYLVDIRVERLQDISEADARAEGIPTNEAGEFLAPERLAPWRFTTARDAFAVWWDEFYGVGMVDSWEASPWVCAVTFKVVTP